MEATTSKEGGLNERGPKAIAHEMGLQVSHGVHSEVGGIQCGGIHQGEECNLDCPELSGTETPFDREEFLSARLFRFHGGDGQTIRAGIHLAAGAGGAAFGGAEHGVGASAAFRRLLTGPFEGLTEISPRLCRGSFNFRPSVRGDRRICAASPTAPSLRTCAPGATGISQRGQRREQRPGHPPPPRR